MDKPFIILISCLVLALSACDSKSGKAKRNGQNAPAPAPDQNERVGEAEQNVNSDVTYEIIDAPEGTFGYNIMMDGKVMIHQPNIPGMPGLKGFINKEDAAKVARIVMDKLKNNQMPPTVTTEELSEILRVE